MPSPVVKNIKKNFPRPQLCQVIKKKISCPPLNTYWKPKFCLHDCRLLALNVLAPLKPALWWMVFSKNVQNIIRDVKLNQCNPHKPVQISSPDLRKITRICAGTQINTREAIIAHKKKFNFVKPDFCMHTLRKLKI